MTERKPAGANFETWVDRQIREATERGEFDDLPGSGKPLPDVQRPYDEHWWVKGYLRREGLSTDALLPTPLRLRKEVQQLPETVRELRFEREVREIAAELNARIVEWLRAPSGPHIPVHRIDVDAVVERWREDRRAARRAAEHVLVEERTAAAQVAERDASRQGSRWRGPWRRRARRRRTP